MKRTGALLLVIVILCVFSASAQEDATCRFIREGLSLFGQTEAEMIAKLGQPEKTVTEELASMWYQGHVDVVKSLWYPGLYLETLYIYQEENSLEYPLTVDVTDPSIAMPLGLRVGASRGEVRSVLGEPVAVSDDGGWLYGCGMEEVSFSFSGDVVNRIVCRGYFP